MQAKAEPRTLPIQGSLPGRTGKAVGGRADRPLLRGREPLLHGGLRTLRLAVPRRGRVHTLRQVCQGQLLRADKPLQPLHFPTDEGQHRHKFHHGRARGTVPANPSTNLPGARLRKGTHLKNHPRAHTLLATAGAVPLLPATILAGVEHCRDAVAQDEEGVAQTRGLCRTGYLVLCS